MKVVLIRTDLYFALGDFPCHRISRPLSICEGALKKKNCACRMRQITFVNAEPEAIRTSRSCSACFHPTVWQATADVVENCDEEVDRSSNGGVSVRCRAVSRPRRVWRSDAIRREP